MKKSLLVVLACAAGLVLPGEARAIGQCGLPSSTPWWIDFGTPALIDVFGKPGMIVAGSSGEFPARVRAAGAHTVYWDMYLNRRVGTPFVPADPGVVEARANRLLDYAAAQSGCDKPLIVLNELFGAHLETPWTRTNTQYRTNVLTFLTTLSSRGARPLLLLSRAPYTGSPEAADWWREAAQHADLVTEVYFKGPNVHKLGPTLGQRRIRLALRQAVARFTEIGIPPARLGVVLGFQTSPGAGGREGLDPAKDWFEVVKWQALAAKQVARETGIASILSWGWASYRPSDHDQEKQATACVYLWARDASLCDGVAAAGAGFDDSRTDGQLVLRAGRQCSFPRGTIEIGALASLRRLTGDREVAYSVLLARLAESRFESVPTLDVLAAERAVIALRFGGSAGAYRAAIAQAGATVGIARAVLADELRRVRIEARLRASTPSAREVSAFYFGYPDLMTRAVVAHPAPWWLGGRTRGLAFESFAPGQLFRLATGRHVFRALEGTYTVGVLDEPRALGSIPFDQARAAISAALRTFSRRIAFERWSLLRQKSALESAICRGDDLPAAGTIRLTSYLPFLALAES